SRLWALALAVLAPERVEALNEAPRRIDLEVLAGRDRRRRRRVGRLIGRSRGPIAAYADAEVVLRAQLAVGDRLPEALRRRLDVDLEDLLHQSLPSSSSLSPLSPETQGSEYLLTHRSWMSLIGTGLRKCSFSRPRLR